MLVEAAVESLTEAVLAERAGAGRLELCDRLDLDGITPTVSTVVAVKAAVGISVFAMIRPRGGDFVYSDEELDVMRADIAVVRSLGVDGVVFGCLTRDGRIDIDHTRALVQAAGAIPVTFHRAFDLVPDPVSALEDLAALGVRRVLTSAGAPTALDGAATIAGLVRRAADRIVVMPGGRVREDNVADVVRLTGAHEVHLRGEFLTRTLVARANDAYE